MSATAVRLPSSRSEPGVRRPFAASSAILRCALVVGICAAVRGDQIYAFLDYPRDWRGSHDRPAWPQWRDALEQAARSYG